MCQHRIEVVDTGVVIISVGDGVAIAVSSVCIHGASRDRVNVDSTG